VEFFGFVLLVLVIAILVYVIGLKSSFRRLHLEMNLLTQRLDFLRKELNRTGAKPGVPTVRAPKPIEEEADEFAPYEDKSERPEIHTEEKMVWEPYPFGTAPPPLPSEREAWKLDSDEEPPEVKMPAFVESAREILRKIWNWILYGADEKPRDVTTEYIVASTWLPRLAVLLPVIGIYFFLTWSMGYLDAQRRVAICMVTGVAMLFAGIKLLGRKYHVIGQGLLGGGLLVLYGSAYAAGPMYHLFGDFSTAWTFALMILVTVAAGVLAVGTDSLLIAVIGIAGGFFTPVMLRTETPNLIGLYSYILLLNLGILGIAYRKQWRLLNYLGFVFTYALFFGSILHGYHRADFPVAMAFLSAFFALNSAIVYFNNILKGNRSTMLEILHLVANAMIFSYFGYYLIQFAYGRYYPAFMSVSLAAFYIAHVFLFLKKRLIDRSLLIALIALGGMFTAWTLPLLFEKESLTISISLLALTFLWLGFKLQCNFLRNLAYAVYFVVFYRLLLMDLGRNFDFRPATAMPMSVYWQHMLERLWTFGVPIASIAGAFMLQRRQPEPAEKFAVEESNDIARLVKPDVAAHIFYWFGLLFLFLFVHLEMNTMFSYNQPFRLPVLTLLWCAMVGFFLWRYITEELPPKVMFIAMCVFLFGATWKLLAIDLLSWGVCDRFYYNVEYGFFDATMRFMDFGMVIAILVLAWQNATRQERLPSSVFGYGALLVFFIYATLELNSLLHWKLPGFRSGGISVLWALFAIAFIAGGIWKKITALRYVGLILFAVVVGKIFLVDLSKLDVIYRVIAFMAVGVFLLLGSFAYIRSSRMFLSHVEDDKNDERPTDDA